MDHGGWPDPHLQILEEIDRGYCYETCSIDEFLTYYTTKSKGEVSDPRWQRSDNGLTIFWHQKEDESQSKSQSESKSASTAFPSDSLFLPNYMGRTNQTHEPNKETLQHKIISFLGSVSLPKRNKFFIQFWAPTKIRGRIVLTTSAQPFGLSYDINRQQGPPEQTHYLFRKGLCRYRKRCLGLEYDVTDHGGNMELGGGGISSSSSQQQQQQLLQLGPPGRVFKQGFPEYSTYIGYYTTQEFPLRDYAINECGILDYLALPLFESTGGHHCLGLLEIVAVDYHFFDYAGACIFETLERAHLRSQPSHLRECSKIRKDNLASGVDIKEVLKFVREVHQLPLVLAWVPCMCGDPEKQVGYHASSCNFPDRAFKTTNFFCEMLDCDSDYWDLDINMDSIHKYGFFSIRQGKGLVGRAYSFKKPCFYRDTSEFSISDYPIVHVTSEAGLTACFAIPLHFLDPSLDGFVLEIFLPRRLQKYSSDRDLVAFLRSLLSTIINGFSRHGISLGLQEGDQVFSVELVSSSSDDDNDNFKFFDICRSGENLNRDDDALENARDELQVQSSLPPPIIGGINVTNDGKTKANVRQRQLSSIAAHSKRPDIAGTSRAEVYTSARARITLDVLEPYFEGNLADAAQSLGVSQTTLQRICRDLGIVDWRSQKRKKVDHHIRSSDPRLSLFNYRKNIIDIREIGPDSGQTGWIPRGIQPPCESESSVGNCNMFLQVGNSLYQSEKKTQDHSNSDSDRMDIDNFKKALRRVAWPFPPESESGASAGNWLS